MKTKPLILIVSCPYGNLQSSRYTKLINGYRKFTINGKQNFFITLTDHKPNFQNNPSVKLSNPAKNKFGRISKTS